MVKDHQPQPTDVSGQQRPVSTEQNKGTVLLRKCVRGETIVLVKGEAPRPAITYGVYLRHDANGLTIRAGNQELLVPFNTLGSMSIISPQEAVDILNNPERRKT